MTNISQKTPESQKLTAKELLYTVDSFALKIPLDSVEITHETLNSMVSEYNIETSVLNENESYKKDSLKISYDHYDFHFKINKHHVGTNQRDKSNIYIPTLSIGINSKHVEERYFEGITLENINIVYAKLMSLKVFECDLKSFMNGYATDYEIKKDEYIDQDIYKKAIEEMHKLTPVRKKTNLGTNIFKSSTNLGLQWNDREKSSVTYPFMKTYYKQIELENRSKGFKDAFLSDRNIKGLSRFEYGVKTKPIARKFKINVTTLKDLLNTSQNEFNRIHKEFVRQNFKDSIMSLKTSQKDTSNLRPIQQLHIKFIEYMLSNGETIELILNYVLEPIQDRKSRYRTKKDLLELYNTNIQGKKKFNKSLNLEKAFNFFGGGNASFLMEEFEEETNKKNT